jgi:hypothetical protein
MVPAGGTAERFGSEVVLLEVGTFGCGDVGTWIAIDADTKLVPTWLVGGAHHGRLLGVPP